MNLARCTFPKQPLFTGKLSGRATTAVEIECRDMRLTDAFCQSQMAKCLFLVATFSDFSEPQIHGYGDTADAAWGIAKINRVPHGAALCARTTDTFPSWKSALGQTVTLEHCGAPQG
jgi:hypothetical protein